MSKKPSLGINPNYKPWTNGYRPLQNVSPTGRSERKFIPHGESRVVTGRWSSSGESHLHFSEVRPVPHPSINLKLWDVAMKNNLRPNIPMDPRLYEILCR